jgi:two-component system response regulator AtoC
VAQVRDVAQNPKTTVLLMGETGTGKEFLARVIHHNSARAKGPFVRINCTTISPQSFERDLFKYERGAFAGAEHRKVGLLEQAEAGTLFLDEVGELDLAMQGRLLGILQDRSFRSIRRNQRHPGRMSCDCLFVSRPRAESIGCAISR